MKEILPKFNNKGYEVLFITGNDYFEEFNNLKLSNNIKFIDYTLKPEIYKILTLE